MALSCGATNINRLHTQSPPYVNSSGINIIGGLVYEGYQSTMQACCKDFANFTYNDKIYSDESQFLDAPLFDYSISMPIYLSSSLVRNAPPNFVAVVQIDYFLMIGQPSAPSDNLAQALVSLWPLILVIWSLSALTGYIFWIIERIISKEKSPFSRHFLKGVFEAFWFAFITAATVGYGDFVARCFIGKVLLLLWSTISVLLFATLTGTFTNLFNIATTSATMNPTVMGSVIGVPSNKLNYIAVNSLGGYPVTLNSANDLTVALVNGTVEGVLIDPQTFASLFPNPTPLWTTYNFQASLVKYPMTAGYMLPSEYTNLVSSNLYACLQQRSLVTQMINSATLINSSSTLIQYEKVTLASTTGSLWSNDGLGIVLGVSAGALILIGLTAIVYHMISRKKCSLEGFGSSKPANPNPTEVDVTVSESTASHIDLHEIPENGSTANGSTANGSAVAIS